jgi:hypothetical protein
MRAFKSTGVVGGLARIRVATEINSPFRFLEIRIKQSKGNPVRFTRRVASRGFVQTVTWRVPVGTKATTLGYCVVGYTGVSGERRAEACSTLTLKKQPAARATTSGRR